MVTAYDVNPNSLINKAAEELKKVDIIKAPAWVSFAKTGVQKERPSTEKDFWYKRCASVLRKIYIYGPIGVSKLRVKYGGRKNRVTKPDAFRKAGGNIIRKVLQQLEKNELIRQAEVGVHKGRVITPKGKKFLDSTAKSLKK